MNKLPCAAHIAHDPHEHFYGWPRQHGFCSGIIAHPVATAYEPHRQVEQVRVEKLLAEHLAPDVAAQLLAEMYPPIPCVLIDKESNCPDVALTCPRTECGAVNAIAERDTATRLNRLASVRDVDTVLTIDWTTGEGDFEHDAYVCAACGGEVQFPAMDLNEDYPG